MADRPFRQPESIESERVTRDMLPHFLRQRGFTDVRDSRPANSQIIRAITPAGERLSMRVRLCWRRDPGSRDSERIRKYSAAQILANVKNGDWEGELQRKIAREKAAGVTHFLFVQRDDESMEFAALVPLSEFLAIWRNQRRVSAKLIREGKLGQLKKNHAENGSSPTVWLKDLRHPAASQVADALWKHRGVIDLAKMTEVSAWLPAEEADEGESAGGDGDYIPKEDDRRRVVERQIKERRGQRSFRDGLRRRYKSRCLVTGCQILDVLEAAHIQPYRGEEDNNLENGLLLRADIHTLFDLNLLGIEPVKLQVKLHPNIAADGEYARLAGVALNCAGGKSPSRKALELRYAQFQLRCQSN